MHTTAVGVNLNRLQPAGREKFLPPAGRAVRRVDAADHPVTNVFNQRRMAVAQRTGGQGQVLKPIFAMVSITVNRQIAAAKRVVKRERHAVA